MRLKTILASATLTLATVLPLAASAQSSEAFGRLARALTHGATDPVRSLRFGITIQSGAGGAESVAMEQDLSYALPDKLRNAVRSPIGRQVIVINGDRGTGMAAGRAQPASDERVEYGRQSMGRQLLMLAGNATDPELRATDRGTESLDGALCDVVEVAYSDYVEMSGYLVPRTRTVSFEGETVATLTVDALDVNPELDPGLFEIVEAP